MAKCPASIDWWGFADDHCVGLQYQLVKIHTLGYTKFLPLKPASPRSEMWVWKYSILFIACSILESIF